MNRLIVSLVLMIGLLIPVAAMADILPPGQKGVSSCFSITNLESFPDYVFLVFDGEPMGGFSVMKSNTDCRGFYKFSSPSMFAIAKDKFDPAEIGDTLTAQQKYITTNPNLIPAINGIPMGPSSLPVSDPRDKVVNLLIIQEIKDDAVGGQLITAQNKIQYTYEDGTTETIDYEPQNEKPRPAISKFMSTYGQKIWYIVLPLFALFVIAAVLLRKKKSGL